MDITNTGKSANKLSFRYNVNNEELEELFPVCDDDPPCENSLTTNECASPKKVDKTSILDKYFKSAKHDKNSEKSEDGKVDNRSDGSLNNAAVSSSPMKEYLNRFSKKSNLSETSTDNKEINETWKIFHDFKFKLTQAVEDIKNKSNDDAKEKVLIRDNSISDSDEISALKDCDQQSTGDTDNQVSSLESSLQNLSEMTQPQTAKATERELSNPTDKKNKSEIEETKKSIALSESMDGVQELNDDNSTLDVESGIEALEDINIEMLASGFGQDKCKSDDCDNPQIKTNNCASDSCFAPNPNNSRTSQTFLDKNDNFFNFQMYFLTFLVVVSFVLWPQWNIGIGFFMGLWFFCFAVNLKEWIYSDLFGDSHRGRKPHVHNGVSIVYNTPYIKEHIPIKKIEGWINHYRFPDYDPYTYHINKTTTALMRLEGCILRISYTSTKVPKRAIWDEKIENIQFYQHRFYNLTGARIILLPKGLVKKRHWSKKYPICIILSEKSKIQVLDKENSFVEKKISENPLENKNSRKPETECAETNTSPEKKKRFIWKKKSQSITPLDEELGNEGVRHRFVRKTHRDSKITENVTSEIIDLNQSKETYIEQSKPLDDESSVPKSDNAISREDFVDEEELDENELSKIKEFLDNVESEPSPEGEGEWSIHVKRSVDKHCLYLFTRTGRDKHEWYRCISSAISEAETTSTDSSNTEDKSNSDNLQENKEGVEMAVYKVSEKENVAFAKSKSKDPASEPPTSSLLNTPHSESYDKHFWPYLIKIMQSGGEVQCECRCLPAEMAWLNMAIARVMYDVTRDAAITSRLQARVQRKLNTIKLPAFMSPLVVTELSLAGACPALSGVRPPACDERGLWLDADLRYEGGAYIAILTQINLMKLKDKNLTLEEQFEALSTNTVDNDTLATTSGAVFSEKQLRRRKPAIFDSDLEDSAESSSDGESPPLQPVDSADNVLPPESPSTAFEGGSSKKKFLRIVDKITTNKYFQQVTDYKYVKRAMEGLSNMDIKLHVEVAALEGRLAINLPPPPHDRLWLGFRTNPSLVLRARPALGARAVRFAHITNWIEQRLAREFEKLLVLPNMEDVLIDCMTPTPINFD